VPSLLGEIGTIEWTRRTNGILGRGERARYLASLALVTLRASPRLLAARAGARGSGPDPSELTPPDSELTREVLEACADLDPMIVEHGYRSYLFARALGVARGLTCDVEALFVAAILHDYVFDEIDSIGDRCFTLACAEVADELLGDSRLSPALRHNILDGLTLHLNPAVGPDQGALQHLLHDGIQVDVLGVHAWQLDPDGVERVADQHPRYGFTPRGMEILRTHMRRVPGCRAGALLTPGFGVRTAVRLSRWGGRDAAAVSEPAAGGASA
jgi:hypothetical protein